jgi:hypothetical protein
MSDTLNKFKRTLIDFIDELIGQFPNEPDLVMVRMFVKDRISIEKLMSLFSKCLGDNRHLIEARNEIFFVNAADKLFQEFNFSTTIFNRLWKSQTLDDEDRTIIWDWVTTLDKLAQKYQLETA